MYIVFEGIDCLGKSTQLKLLKPLYPDATFTQEPGGSCLGREIRSLIFSGGISKKAELLLFLADRAQHYEEILKNHSNLIISDRSFISGIAYAMNDYDIDFLLTLNQFVLNSKLPQKVVFFKGKKELILKRLSQKRLDAIEKRGIEYFLQIQDNFEILIRKLNIPTLTIDAGDSINSIHIKIKDFIDDTSN